MDSIKLEVVFAFKSPEGGGNPAGVVLGADQLTENRMQEIAAEAGYSETVFVSDSEVADFKLDFFTPNRRIPDCGHATVAAFSLLKDQNPELLKSSKETVAGVRDIEIKNDHVYMDQPIGAVEPVPLSKLQEHDLFGNYEGFLNAHIVRHDVGFLIVEVESDQALKTLRPNFAAIKKHTDDNNLVGVYVFVRPRDTSSPIQTRMFAPAYGIDEESATGMAGGLLASLLFSENKQTEFLIEQGRYMSPSAPSYIYCDVLEYENKVLVGGASRIDTDGEKQFAVN